MNFIKKIILWLVRLWMYTSTVIVTAIIIIIIGIAIFIPNFFEIDTCLDRGGAWNEEKNECAYSEEELR